MKTFFVRLLSPYIALLSLLSPLPPQPAPVPVVYSDHLDLQHLTTTVDNINTRLSYIEDHTSNLGNTLGASLPIPTSVALFETSLASKITSSATSMSLVSATDKSGTALASSTYAFILDEGSASEEMVLADCTGTTCTNMVRGISVLTGTTTVSSLRFSHGRGASVKITDGPQLMILSRIINGIGSFPNKLSYTSEPTFTNGTEIPDKTYIDGLIAAGCANASTIVKGCVEIATGVEVASSSASGSTGALLAIPASQATSTPGNSTSLDVVVTKNNGKIDPGFLNGTSEVYNLSSVNIASSTLASSTAYIINVGTLNATSTITIGGFSVPVATNVQVFSTPGSTSWTKPSGAVSVDVYVFGSGGGGGSGGRQSGSPQNATGGAGGGGGGFGYKKFSAGALGSTETVTIGAVGTGGAGVTTNVVGITGVAGGASSFGTTVLVRAGGGGAGGGGDSGGGNSTAGTAGTQGNGIGSQIGGVGGGYGGAGPASTATELSPRGGGQGAQGNNSTVALAGGGFITNYVQAGGTVGGGAGATLSSTLLQGGPGGGGGDPNTTGGAGGFPGGGGGGGGGASGATTSGGGAAGAAGMVVVITYF